MCGMWMWVCVCVRRQIWIETGAAVKNTFNIPFNIYKTHETEAEAAVANAEDRRLYTKETCTLPLCTYAGRIIHSLTVPLYNSNVDEETANESKMSRANGKDCGTWKFRQFDFIMCAYGVYFHQWYCDGIRGRCAKPTPWNARALSLPLTPSKLSKVFNQKVNNIEFCRERVIKKVPRNPVCSLWMRTCVRRCRSMRTYRRQNATPPSTSLISPGREMNHVRRRKAREREKNVRRWCHAHISFSERSKKKKIEYTLFIAALCAHMLSVLTKMRPIPFIHSSSDACPQNCTLAMAVIVVLRILYIHYSYYYYNVTVFIYDLVISIFVIATVVSSICRTHTYSFVREAAAKKRAHPIIFNQPDTNWHW